MLNLSAESCCYFLLSDARKCSILIVLISLLSLQTYTSLLFIFQKIPPILPTVDWYLSHRKYVMLYFSKMTTTLWDPPPLTHTQKGKIGKDIRDCLTDTMKDSCANCVDVWHPICSIMYIYDNILLTFLNLREILKVTS